MPPTRLDGTVFFRKYIQIPLPGAARKAVLQYESAVEATYPAEWKIKKRRDVGFRITAQKSKDCDSGSRKQEKQLDVPVRFNKKYVDLLQVVVI